MFNPYNPYQNNIIPNQSYNMNYNNPYSVPLKQDNGNLLRVNGMDGAKAFQMLPNTTVALFDSNEDIFYVKSADAGGFSNVKAYKFNPIEEVKTPVLSENDFVTRKEFDELKGEIVEYGKQFIREQSKTSKSESDKSN